MASFSNLALTSVLVVVLYNVSLVAYRWFWHPLARFPGPRIAALTYWHEFYFDVIKDGGGRHHWEITKMHQKYGPCPIVRITPDEIHVDDPNWFEVLFASGSEVREKHAPAAHMVGTSLGIFSTVEYRAHRRRKAAVSHFFSKRSIHSKEHVLREKLALLCDALEDQSRTNLVVNLHASLLAFATDVFCAYVLGGSPGEELLPSFERQVGWQRMLDATENLTPVLKQIQFAVPLINTLPSRMLRPFAPGTATVFAMKEGMRQIAKREIQQWHDTAGLEKPIPQAQTIFSTILGSSLPVEEKSLKRLEEESFELLFASGQTFARVTTYGFFHLLSNPDKLARLQREIRLCMHETSSDRLSLSEIENLPYLGAVIKESLRISAMVFTRMPLICPTSDLEYGDHVVPARTPISMTPGDMLLDERCYAHARSFRPERWLGEDGLEIPSDKYYVPFSKGHRVCPGINIAYTEMFLVIAELVTRYDMTLYDTIRERDVDHHRDYFLGKPHRSSKGVRVTLRRNETAS